MDNKRKQSKCKFSVDYEILYTPESDNYNLVNPLLVFHKANDSSCYFISFDTLGRWGFPRERAEKYDKLPFSFVCEDKIVCALTFVKCLDGFKYIPQGDYKKGLAKAHITLENCDKWCNKNWKLYALDVELDTAVKNPLVGKTSITCYSSGNGIWHTAKTANRPNTAKLTLVNGHFLSMDYKQPMAGGKRIKGVIVL